VVEELSVGKEDDEEGHEDEHAGVDEADGFGGVRENCGVGGMDCTVSE
jgi:hypothetical protein